jgi:hypothetical protein
LAPPQSGTDDYRQQLTVTPVDVPFQQVAGDVQPVDPAHVAQ